MNAPLAHVHVKPLGNFEDFLDVCGFEAWYFERGWKSKQIAVDQLQNLAWLWGLAGDDVAQDEVQAAMAMAFARVRSGA